jgi:hypothetical protein
MKYILVLFFSPLLLFGQTQIGSDIDGENEGDSSATSLILASDGSKILIGAPRNNGNGLNSVLVPVVKTSECIQ